MKKYMVLVCGKSGSGKTYCLRNLPKQKGVLYLNCEGDEELPFNNKFQNVRIEHPQELIDAVKEAEEYDDIHTIAIDSITFLCDMYVNNIVYTSPKVQQAWGEYARFVSTTLMMNTLAPSTKNIIITSHTVEEFDETTVLETKVNLPGKQLNIKGFESFFNHVVGTRKIAIDDLADYKNPSLTINDWEKATGYKYVLQTRSSADSIKDRLRVNPEHWHVDELYIDNDITTVLNRMRNGKPKR